MEGNKIDSLPAATTAERVEDNSQVLTTELENASINDSSFIQAMIKAPSGFKLDDTGVYLVSSDEKASKKISSPIWVTAVTEDQIDGSVGVVIAWRDLKKKIRKKAFPMDALYDSGADFIKYLGKASVISSPGQANNLKKYLLGFVEDLPFIGSVTKLGWIDSDNEELIYVLPERVIDSGDSNQEIIFQPEQHSYTSGSIYSSCDYYKWSEKVAYLCSGNPMLVFALCVGYSCCLMRFTGLEAGGFNIYGRSSGGKTTLLQVAASVMGNGSAPGGDPYKSLIQTWNTTGNALEALASAANDGILCLDEIHTCNDHDFGRVVYNLSGGRGKARLGQDADLKKSRSWRLIVLSTGEISSREKILDSTKKVHSGQLLRLIDIPADDNIIVDTGKYNPAEFCDLLKKNCSEYFGEAGPTFIKMLIYKYGDSYTAQREIAKRFDEIYRQLRLPNMEREQERALKKFAHIATAGCLASELGGLPLDESEIISSVKHVVGLWLSEEANLPVKVKSARMVREFIQKNLSRFQVIKAVNDVPPPNLVGYIHEGIANGQTQKMFLFTDDGFREACGGQNPYQVAQDLKEMGFLHINDTHRPKAKHTVYIGGAQQRSRYFTLLNPILSFDEFEHVGNGTGGTNGNANNL